MSVYSQIAREQAEQLEEDGRPLLQYVVTRFDMVQLKKEVGMISDLPGTLKKEDVLSILRCPVFLYFNGQQEPCKVVVGP